MPTLMLFIEKLLMSGCMLMTYALMLSIEELLMSGFMLISWYTTTCEHALAVSLALSCVQIDLLKQQPAILVATPGRLLDLIDDEDCNLSLGIYTLS